MDLFARCFLLVFAQLYIGGLLSLSIPPFHQIERGFYKSSAGVYLFLGFAAFLGRIALIMHPPQHAAPTTHADLAEILLWLTSLAAGSIYMWSLWGEPFALRARAFAIAWLSGLAALVVAAQSFRLGPALSVETVLYPLSFLVSALVLGAVTTGMLLGHWYLIDRSLSIEPFRTLLRFFVAMLLIQGALLVLGSGLLGLVGAANTGAELTRLINEHGTLLLVRVLLSPISAAALAWMIWKTLQIPQTMAATGLFYVAILSVLMGEMMSRFILFRTSIPL